jgi:hypothetical protein
MHVLGRTTQYVSCIPVPNTVSGLVTSPLPLAEGRRERPNTASLLHHSVVHAITLHERRENEKRNI